MAEELRYDNRSGTVADGQTASNNDNSFLNQDSDDLFVRQIMISGRLRTAASDERCEIELSKSPVLAVNNDTHFVLTTTVEAGGSGGSPDDGSYSKDRFIQLARGQLTLEQHERLHINVAKTSGGTCTYEIVIGFHH